ncbi:MAG TPA: hypothetical protein VFM37_08995 [Pseudonocardiaceae bacterium]|nr:hypothetical protein [Pseudonocardiaceae bacterium]
MRSRVAWLLLVPILVAAVAVLRSQSALPDRGPATAPGPTVVPTPAPRVAPPSVPRVIGGPLNWREVPLPADSEPGSEPAADLERQVFHTTQGDGVRRIVVAGAAVGELPPGQIRSRLVGRHLVVQREVAPGVSELSALDLTAGQWRTASGHLSVRQLAAGGRFVVVPADERCMVVHELATLARLARYCADPGRFVSLLTAEDGGPQWRESAPGRPCARWLRLDRSGVPRVLRAGPAACRAAVLLTLDGWELTADFPPYETGAAYPGPLIAHMDDRGLTLDASVLQPQACGRHVYWLSRPRTKDQRGALARWAPGADRVELLTPGNDERLRADAAPPRCVNGVLNVLTTAAGDTRLWLLPTP